MVKGNDMSNAPTFEQMLKSNMRWRSEYKDVGIELSFHGYVTAAEDKWSHVDHGTWCYYLILNELMFNATDWKKLRFFPNFNDYGHETYDYWNFPDVDFHSGISFYEVNKQYSRTVKRHIEIVKAGCDYNHLWDSEAGYPDNYESVLFDAKHSVSKLLKQFPNVNKCCGWSGIWDSPENFYLAKNGKMVHNSQIKKLKKDNYDGWLPNDK